MGKWRNPGQVCAGWSALPWLGCAALFVSDERQTTRAVRASKPRFVRRYLSVRRSFLFVVFSEFIQVLQIFQHRIGCDAEINETSDLIDINRQQLIDDARAFRRGTH